MVGITVVIHFACAERWNFCHVVGITIAMHFACVERWNFHHVLKNQTAMHYVYVNGNFSTPRAYVETR